MDIDSGIESKARELLEGRVATVTDLSRSLAHLDEVRAQVANAEKAATTAWSTATDAGWTENELRHLGFTRPSGKRAGRTTSSRRRQPAPVTPREVDEG